MCQRDLTTRRLSQDGFRLTKKRGQGIVVRVISPVVARIPSEEIAQFCQKWNIHQLALFGSVLRDDFRADSDIDMMVTFAPDAHWSLFDHMRMQQELQQLFGRKVDLISRRALEQSPNWLLRDEILGAAQVWFDPGEATHAS